MMLILQNQNKIYVAMTDNKLYINSFYLKLSQMTSILNNEGIMVILLSCRVTNPTIWALRPAMAHLKKANALSYPFSTRGKI